MNLDDWLDSRYMTIPSAWPLYCVATEVSLQDSCWSNAEEDGIWVVEVLEDGTAITLFRDAPQR